MRFKLLMPDPIEGGDPITPAAPAPGPAPGPAAVIVKGGKTETEINLERELEQERAGRRTAEFKAAEEERKRQEAEDRLNAPRPPRREKRGRLGGVISFEPDEEGNDE